MPCRDRGSDRQALTRTRTPGRPSPPHPHPSPEHLPPAPGRRPARRASTLRGCTLALCGCGPAAQAACPGQHAPASFRQFFWQQVSWSFPRRVGPARLGPARLGRPWRGRVPEGGQRRARPLNLVEVTSPTSKETRAGHILAGRAHEGDGEERREVVGRARADGAGGACFSLRRRRRLRQCRVEASGAAGPRRVPRRGRGVTARAAAARRPHPRRAAPAAMAAARGGRGGRPGPAPRPPRPGCSRRWPSPGRPRSRRCPNAPAAATAGAAARPQSAAEAEGPGVGGDRGPGMIGGRPSGPWRSGARVSAGMRDGTRSPPRP